MFMTWRDIQWPPCREQEQYWTKNTSNGWLCLIGGFVQNHASVKKMNKNKQTKNRDGEIWCHFSFQASNTSATNTHANLNWFSNERITKKNATHQVTVYSGSIIHYLPFYETITYPTKQEANGKSSFLKRALLGKRYNLITSLEFLPSCRYGNLWKRSGKM